MVTKATILVDIEKDCSINYLWNNLGMIEKSMGVKVIDIIEMK